MDTGVPTQRTLETAIEHIKRAVAADQANDLTTAYAAYKEGLEHLLSALRREGNEHRRQIMTQKASEYMSRAEKIKAVLEQRTGTGNSATTKSSAQATTEHQTPIDEYIMPTPRLSFDDVKGLKDAKNTMKESIILPAKFPQLFSSSRRQPWRGVLLYGPPGTGKTLLAKAAAAESGCLCLTLSACDLNSRYANGWIEAEKRIKQVFQRAAAHADEKIDQDGKPCHKTAIVLFDEIECLSTGYDNEASEDYTRRNKTEFLVQFHAAVSSSVTVVATTNCPWAIDAAVRRRFEKRVYVPLPDLEARKEMLSEFIASSSMRRNAEFMPPLHAMDDDELSSLAAATEGYSGSDINCICRDALMTPVREIQNATHFRRVPVEADRSVIMACCPEDDGAMAMTMTDLDDAAQKDLAPRPITQADVAACVARSKPTVDDTEVKRHLSFRSDFGEDV